MSGLITLLEKQHVDLISKLKTVKELGVTSEAGQKALLATKASLVAHLKIEDEELYPVLKKAAEEDASLKRMVDRYITEMEKITENTLQFFEKHSKGGSGMEFAKDYGRLVGAISTRMRSEENSLYKKYIEVVSQ